MWAVPGALLVITVSRMSGHHRTHFYDAGSEGTCCFSSNTKRRIHGLACVLGTAWRYGDKCFEIVRSGEEKKAKVISKHQRWPGSWFYPEQRMRKKLEMASSWKMVRKRQKKENEGIRRKWSGPKSPGDVSCCKIISTVSILSPSFNLKSTTFSMSFQEHLEKLVQPSSFTESQ